MDDAVDHTGHSFSGKDLERVRAETFIEQVDFHRELVSTNDRALELADQGCCHPTLVLTEVQTAGRGRGANRWWAGKGALTFSVLLETKADQLPPSLWPQLSLTAGLAVCEALEGVVNQAIHLKWPNDVYCRQRKLSGILVEVPRVRQGMLVLGIGVNVNNSLAGAPQDLRARATTLCDVAGQSFPLADVLLEVLHRLWQRTGCIGTRDAELRQRWRERCLLTNRTVHVDLGQRRVTGVCRGIDDDGALLVHTQEGTERYFAGEVTRFE